MDTAEFDKFAEAYLATHAANIKISGEDPEYFARSKIAEVRRRWSACKHSDPAAILDFGAGIGSALPFLKAAFPNAALTGLDVSEKSLGVAERRFPNLAQLVRYDGGAMPLQDQSFDLIFSACVFHHINADLHVQVFRQLKRLLRPGGLMTIFEHNPLNPVTRHIVATCAFDENAVLVPSWELSRSQTAAGFADVDVTYTSFFPKVLATLRPLERFMAALPIGAQYYTLTHG